MKDTDATFRRVIEIANEFGATKLVLFGSALRSLSDARDLDLACDGVAGWKIFELGAALESELRVPVDLVPLSPPTKFSRMIESVGRRLI